MRGEANRQALARFPYELGDVEAEIGRERRAEAVPADRHRRVADDALNPVRRAGADLGAVEADESHAGVDAPEALFDRCSGGRGKREGKEIGVDHPFGEAARPADGGGVAGRVRVVAREKSVEDDLPELHGARNAGGQGRRIGQDGVEREQMADDVPTRRGDPRLVLRRDRALNIHVLGVGDEKAEVDGLRVCDGHGCFLLKLRVPFSRLREKVARRAG